MGFNLNVGRNGAKLKGYFVWSFLDDFEWNQGYLDKFGLIYVDRKKNLKRIVKDSGKWYKKLLHSKRVEDQPLLLNTCVHCSTQFKKHWSWICCLFSFCGEEGGEGEGAIGFHLCGWYILKKKDWKRTLAPVIIRILESKAVLKDICALLRLEFTYYVYFLLVWCHICETRASIDMGSAKPIFWSRSPCIESIWNATWINSNYNRTRT